MGFEGGALRNNVPADERARDLNRAAFPEIDENLLDDIPKVPVHAAANEAIYRSDAGPEPITRTAVETDPAVLAELLAEAELELAAQINQRPGFNADTDPTAPTGVQTVAAGQIFAGDRPTNLDRVVLPQGIPLRAGGGTADDIRKVKIVANEVPSWQKPGPARESSQTRPSLLKRWFG